MIDNRDFVRRFISPEGDGDTFWYTELLDRSTNGASRFKMLRTFEHTDRMGFDLQMDTVARLCETNGVRAYTRLSPRSRKAVAGQMLRRVAMEYTDGHFDVFGRIYASVVGSTCIHDRKLWLWDVDEPNDASEALRLKLAELGLLRATIPSRKGYHIITPGFDIRRLEGLDVERISLHKDNPTNLYIPESAK